MPIALLSFMAAIYAAIYAGHCVSKKRAPGTVGALLLCLLCAGMGVLLLV